MCIRDSDRTALRGPDPRPQKHRGTAQRLLYGADPVSYTHLQGNDLAGIVSPLAVDDDVGQSIIGGGIQPLHRGGNGHAFNLGILGNNARLVYVNADALGIGLLGSVNSGGVDTAAAGKDLSLLHIFNYFRINYSISEAVSFSFLPGSVPNKRVQIA